MFLRLVRSMEQIWVYELYKAAQSAEEHLWDPETPDFLQSVLLFGKRCLQKLLVLKSNISPTFLSSSDSKTYQAGADMIGQAELD